MNHWYVIFSFLFYIFSVTRYVLIISYATVQYLVQIRRGKIVTGYDEWRMKTNIYTIKGNVPSPKMTKIKKTIPRDSKGVEELELSHTAGGSVNWCTSNFGQLFSDLY